MGAWLQHVATSQIILCSAHTALLHRLPDCTGCAASANAAVGSGRTAAVFVVLFVFSSYLGWRVAVTFNSAHWDTF